MRFEWDRKKEQLNVAKHGVSFREAKELFTSKVDFLELYDGEHSELEERFIAIGPIRRGLVLVVYTERNEGTVRIISADSFTGAEDQRNPNSAGAVPLPTNSPEPFYRARIAIDRVALRNVPTGFRMVPGMPVAADIKVGKRTVLQYLLARVMPVVHDGMREP